MAYLRVTVYAAVRCRGSAGLRNCLRAAQALFRRFHHFAAPVLVRTTCDRHIPKVLVRLGRLRGLIYSSDRGRPGCPRTFVHFLKTPAVLTSDPQGRQLYILGGRYRVTRLGIEG